MCKILECTIGWKKKYFKPNPTDNAMTLSFQWTKMERVKAVELVAVEVRKESKNPRKKTLTKLQNQLTNQVQVSLNRNFFV